MKPKRRPRAAGKGRGPERAVRDPGGDGAAGPMDGAPRAAAWMDATLADRAIMERVGEIFQEPGGLGPEDVIRRVGARFAKIERGDPDALFGLRAGAELDRWQRMIERGDPG